MNPDRIIVGECRGPETMALLWSLATGHAGMTSIHGESAEHALKNLVRFALTSGARIEAEQALDWLREIDLVVHCDRPRSYDSRRATLPPPPDRRDRRGRRHRGQPPDAQPALHRRRQRPRMGRRRASVPRTTSKPPGSRAMKHSAPLAIIALRSRSLPADAAPQGQHQASHTHPRRRRPAEQRRPRLWKTRCAKPSERAGACPCYVLWTQPIPRTRHSRRADRPRGPAHRPLRSPRAGVRVRVPSERFKSFRSQLDPSYTTATATVLDHERVSRPITNGRRGQALSRSTSTTWNCMGRRDRTVPGLESGASHERTRRSLALAVLGSCLGAPACAQQSYRLIYSQQKHARVGPCRWLDHGPSSTQGRQEARAGCGRVVVDGNGSAGAPAPSRVSCGPLRSDQVVARQANVYGTSPNGVNACAGVRSSARPACTPPLRR